ncbi:hypothetical protein L7F22_020014 [Adiantum nelumboides]|nr:hypothetical protein [Adiantum nelumboides]
MTRARNRRRRVPLHPSTTGSFHPIKVDSNSASCKTDGSVEKGDSTPAHEHRSQPDPNAGNQRLEDPQIGKKDVNGRQSHGHISPKGCPHHHHHHHHHQQFKREGKEGSDLRKTLASKHHVTEDGKMPSKPQEYTPYLAARAKELKEEGNRLFQKKDYSSAMDQYELALKLTPPDHPDRAVFHSNRAACLMQMKPISYEDAIEECNLALHAHPGFPRALLRRARAFEAIGKLELALQDVELLLQGDVRHPDAVEMARRIRLCIGNEGDTEAQRHDQDMLPTSISPSDEQTHVEQPANATVQSREAPSISIPLCNEETEVNTHNEDDDGTVLTPIPSSRQMQTPPKPSSQPTRFQPLPHTPPHEALPSIPPCKDSTMTSPLDSSDANNPPSFDPCKSETLKKVIHQDSIQILQPDGSTPHMRPLKLIYDHDIRLAEMPMDCKFGDLRKLVRERFPSSKSILIKYKDAEGDLVTITSTHDLRLAEAAAAIESTSRSFRMASIGPFLQGQHEEDSAIGLPVVPSPLDQLRLHVVEVSADQEPYDKEEICMVKAEGSAISRDGRGTTQSKLTLDNEANLKEKEDFDKWLLDFAQLFRAHLGIDPNGHLDLHERGMELCAEALEEIASTEEAHRLFGSAASKFQEMAALGFLNWGNVYMCAARKQLPHDDSDDHGLSFCDRLQAAFNWAQAQYALAEQKFAESIRVKPDFFDAMLSLGQRDFESAKLHWSLAIAKQLDLSSWDSTEMLKLFHKAEKTMQEAADLVEKQECSTKEFKCSVAKMEDADELQGKSNVDCVKSAFEQDVALKSQVYLFWGNILYEHSQVVFRLGFPSWKELLDGAVEKFEIAGASPLDVLTALRKHLSNSTVFLDANERTGQEAGSNQERQETGDTKEPPEEVVVSEFLPEDDSKAWKDMARDHDRLCDENDMAKDEDQCNDGMSTARDGDVVDPGCPVEVLL